MVSCASNFFLRDLNNFFGCCLADEKEVVPGRYTDVGRCDGQVAQPRHLVPFAVSVASTLATSPISLLLWTILKLTQANHDWQPRNLLPILLEFQRYYIGIDYSVHQRSKGSPLRSSSDAIALDMILRSPSSIGASSTGGRSTVTILSRFFVALRCPVVPRVEDTGERQTTAACCIRSV